MILLDTSVLIDIRSVVLPDVPTVLSSISYGELWFGVESTSDASQRRTRIARIAQIEAMFNTSWLPYDQKAAVSNGILAALVAKTRPGHARGKDIMLAGHAHALGAALVTLNPKDFEVVADEVEIVVPGLR